MRLLGRLFRGDDRIRLTEPLYAQGKTVPAGDYRVRVDEERRHLHLEGGSGAVTLTAEDRPGKARVRRPAAHLRPVQGEPRRLLIVRTPPATEWVISLDEDRA